ncbi:MAG: cell wall metabolism sensor histidine kinase WalK, partial [bacterium]|nr:cell wall metabolism sensor histidine kinase WalK [bacterium]
MKFFQNLSIKNKLIVLVLSVALLAIGIGFALVITNNIKTFKDDMINTTKTTADFLADACSAGLSFGSGYEEEVEEEMGKLKIQAIIENAVIYNVDKEVYAAYNRDKNSSFEAPTPSDKEQVAFEGDYLHLYQFIYYKEEIFGTLYLRATTAPLNEKINRYLQTMAVGLVVLILLTYLLAARLQRVISQPILKLAGVTEDIREKADYSMRVEKQGNDEIAVLYTGFNNMLEQIQLREKQRDQAESEQHRLMAELAEKNKEL